MKEAAADIGARFTHVRRVARGRLCQTATLPTTEVKSGVDVPGGVEKPLVLVLALLSVLLLWVIRTRCSRRRRSYVGHGAYDVKVKRSSTGVGSILDEHRSLSWSTHSDQDEW